MSNLSQNLFLFLLAVLLESLNFAAFLQVKRFSDGQTVYGFVRVSGVGRLRGVGYGGEIAGQHHRHASLDGFFAVGLGEAALGEGDFGLLGGEHGLFLCSARCGVNALFRCDCSGVLADCHGHGSQHGVGFDCHGTRTSMGKETWNI